MMSLWVDDSKPVPTGIEAFARTYDDALRLMRTFEYGTLYLDHDLGDVQGRTGLDLLRAVLAEGRCPPTVICISWNPVGRKNIEAELAGRVLVADARDEGGKAATAESRVEKVLAEVEPTAIKAVADWTRFHSQGYSFNPFNPQIEMARAIVAALAVLREAP